MKEYRVYRILVFACFVLLVALSTRSSAQEDEVTTSADTAKRRMKVLAGYIGQWQAESERELPDGSTKKIVEPLSYEWLYEGMWIKGTTVIDMPMGPMKLTTIFGWDELAKQYKSYSFTDQGTGSQATGKWDPRAEVIRWNSTIKVKDADLTMKLTHRTKFDGPDEFSTDVTVIGFDGKKISFRSIAKRVKPKAGQKSGG